MTLTLKTLLKVYLEKGGFEYYVKENLGAVEI
jgi:hypothetical protein